MSAESRPTPIIPEYTLLQKVGGGAFGEVWLAESIFGTRRAVKIVYRDRFEDQKYYEREFSAIRNYEPLSCAHPRLVNVFHVGQSREGGYFYYVMELADAAADASSSAPSGPKYHPKTLNARLTEQGCLSVEETLDLTLSLSEALGFLHQNQLLHRDVKPSNIIFIQGIPKLADLGLLSSTSEAGSFVGTRGYIPPEGHVDFSGDLYSLGKVLYQCAWGKDRLQFPDPPTDLDTRQDHAALIELNEIMLKACEGDPTKRYRSVDDLRSDLVLLKQGRSIRQLRRLEGQARLWRRTGVAITALAVLIALGWSYQKRQSDRLKAALEEKQSRISQLQIAEASRLLDEGDCSAALLRALKGYELDPRKEENDFVHRSRLGALARGTATLASTGWHSNSVNSVEISPDGRHILSAGQDGMAQVWEAQSGKPLGSSLLHGKAITKAVFSPDGTYIATAGEDGSVKLWQAGSNQLLAQLIGHNKAIQSLQFSPRGDYLTTGCSEGVVRVWSCPRGLSVGEPIMHKAEINTLSFSPEGSEILSSSDDGEAIVWKSAAQHERVMVFHHGDHVRQASFSPSGKHVLTACRDGAARIWSTESGMPLFPPIKTAVPLYFARYSVDGDMILTAGCLEHGNGEARLWDAKTGEPKSPVMYVDAVIRSAAISPDKKFVVIGTRNNLAILWDANTGKRLALLRHGQRVRSVAFTPDSTQVLTASKEPFWRLWSLPSAGTPIYTGPNHFVTFSSDGQKLFTTDMGHYIQIWSIVDGKPSQLIETPPDRFGNVIFSRDNTEALLLGYSGVVRASPFTFKPFGPRFSLTETGEKGCYSKTLQRAASLSIDGRVQLWDMQHSKEIPNSRLPLRGVSRLIGSPDGSVFLTLRGEHDILPTGSAQLWAMATGELLSDRLVTNSATFSAAFSPDSKTLFIAHGMDGDQQSVVEGWNLPSRSLTRLNLLHSGTVEDLAVSPDGQHLATASQDGTARIWNCYSGDPICKPIQHEGYVSKVAFSANGKLLATSSRNNRVRIWDAKTGEPISPWFRQEFTTTYELKFGPGDTSLVCSRAGIHKFETCIWNNSKLKGHPSEWVGQIEAVAMAYVDDTGGLVTLTSDQMKLRLVHQQMDGGKNPDRKGAP